MEYRRFGRTELQVPVLSCGGMRYQHKWQDMPLEEIPKDSQDNLEATIRRAVELGINHIETARGYGSSERQLGEILPKLPREKIIVQTKVGPSKDPEEFRKGFRESLERLKLGYVDLLALHGINGPQDLENSIRPGGCLAAAREFQKQGLARHIGFSTHGDRQVILDAIRHEGDGGFDYVNLHWYYIFQHNWPAIEEATRRDMGVFIISPSDKGGRLYDPPEKLVELTKPLHPIIFNDIFCLSHPEVHTLSIGAAKPTDFDLHVEALDYLDKADELVPPIDQRLRQAMKEAMGIEHADEMREGLARWEDTPGQVSIATILWLLNLTKGFDMTEYGKMRYNLLGNGGYWFAGYMADKIGEVDVGPAIQDSPFKDRIPALLKEAHDLLYREPVKRLSQSDS